ncbi:lipopolysaccharide biosynthesis protein [uncultured Algibacter sp.]|uniref:lipopolysaccharide biosynthesis protein n=1 Tax=uncultured Algibacter sp. TaxID=298659 RepID=UPI00345C80E8
MGVSLYTSRVVLIALGVEDYGIYSIVGGIVSMFAFFNMAMSSATQRYLAFDLGRNDIERLTKTFNAAVNIHIIIAVIVFILTETIGLWFVNYKLNVPVERMNAINWVYQFSIFTFLFGIIQVPYNALIIAHERMNIYAYMSIVEVLLKLLIVFLLLYINTDKLILYGFLIFVISVIIRSCYKLYCKRNFKESVYQYYFDKKLYKELITYSGWNMFGNIASIARGQGCNLLLNMFFGPIANAAYGITLTVQGAVLTFVGNFQTAMNPQIIKTYANGEINKTFNFMFKSAKFSFFAMLILVLPIIFNLDYILNLWLVKVPKFAYSFIFLSFIKILIDSISNPIMTGIQATGNIKWYQIIVGGLIFLNLPFSYLALFLTNRPEWVFLISIFISIVSFGARLKFLEKLMHLNIMVFLKKVLFPILIVITITLPIVLFLHKFIKLNETLFVFFINSSIIFFITILIIYGFGINKEERKWLKNIYNNLKSRLLSKTQ